MQASLHDLKTDLKSQDIRITDLENALGHFEGDMSDMKDSVSQHDQALADLSEHTSLMSGLKEQNRKLKDRMVAMEDYSRRSNLLFLGIKETKDEDAWDKIKQDVLIDKMKIQQSTADNIKVERCHRLFKAQGLSSTEERPIIVRFNCYQDKKMIWGKRFSLKGTSIVVREDFAPETNRARSALRPALEKAKKLDPEASINAGQMFFKGKSYKIDNLPSEILLADDTGPSSKVVKDYLCFSGRSLYHSAIFIMPLSALKVTPLLPASSITSFPKQDMLTDLMLQLPYSLMMIH